ncbi:nhl repeat protein [Xanthomonas albilineans]|uniref:nhl repeat protein n=1 Tax=Xanthomonas albilineans TaxID=29447 RepID=UPI0005F35E31|nr:nhl repeat protein [Xanthomonas albilineans]
MNSIVDLGLPSSSVWLNVAPTALREQQGRAIVLAFVNAASVWCMQRLAEVSHWQVRNPGRLQMIVVQVPRFDNEREPQGALKLLRRQGISAPIVLDADWAIWQRFNIQSWPTLVLLDAAGLECERLVGIGGAELDKALHALCAEQPLSLDDELPEVPETQPEPRLMLRFPAGLALDEDRLYIADSGHHRILECTTSGRLLRQFGTGTADFIDGELGQAAFHRPQGLALQRGVLYVADTGNHALRRIHLLTGQVDTLCGNGRAGEPVEGLVEQPLLVSLNHPQDLVVADNQVYLAMAGDNCIWSYNLGSRSLRRCAGSGTLELRDGSAHLAAFAQPCSLAVVNQVLYVCDALGSSVRSMQLRGDLVQTLLGGQGVWDFGHEDGPRSRARLQFPQAIALSPDALHLWIADSGNGSLRSLRLGGGELSTVALPRRLHGPAGLAVSAGAVWIAEADAHAVLRYDLGSGELSEVPISE